MRTLTTISFVLWMGVSVLLFASRSYGFHIHSFRSDPCHEKMVLGTFDRQPFPFSASDDPTLENLISEFVRRVEGRVPSDAATQGMIREISNFYGLRDLSLEERYVLSSLVAGTRSPDTDGFSIVDFNEVRHIHIQDENQGSHALRRSTMEEPSGSIESIREAQGKIIELTRSVLTQWQGEGELTRAERWTFPFYGEKSVLVFGPAYDIGVLSHVIQDSYAHAYRDEQMRILTIANYVDVMHENHHEERDGPPHSDRLDRCEVYSDDFDRARVQAAVRATARYLEALSNRLASRAELDNPPDNPQVILNDIFEYRPGCSHENQYCGSIWAEKAAEDFTKPFSLAACGSLLSKKQGPGKTSLTTSGKASSVLILLLTGLWVLWMRNRFRNRPHSQLWSLPVRS